jgi:hypothetical protein
VMLFVLLFFEVVVDNAQIVAHNEPAWPNHRSNIPTLVLLIEEVWGNALVLR